jgi:hypothetical protein
METATEEIVLQPEKTCESFPKPFQKVEAFPNLQNFQNPVAMESTSVPASPDASASASAAPVAVAPRKPLDLPICSFRGPEVNLPWTERTELPVEQQLEDAVQRIQLAQEERHKLEEEVGSGKYPCLDKEFLGVFVSACRGKQQNII